MAIDVFIREVSEILPRHRIITDDMLCYAYGTDASCYRITPKVVLQVDNETELIRLLSLSNKHRVPVTFRAAGTSLNGQSVSDSVLITLTENWRRLSVEPLGETLHCQSGATVKAIVKALRPYSRRLALEVESSIGAMMGGLVANNAPGITQSAQQGMHRAVKAMRVILPNGELLDTRDEDSIDAFRRHQKELLNHLTAIRARVFSQPSLVSTIRDQSLINAASGYALSALLDFEDPIDILVHLMVGSEGTLGFISEVSLSTVDEGSYLASAMVAFDTVQACMVATSQLKSANVDSVYFMDSTSLFAVQHQFDFPLFSRKIPDEGGVLIIDVEKNTQDDLQRDVERINTLLDQYPLINSTGFTTDKQLIDAFQQAKQHVGHSIAAVRPVGTTMVNEDVRVPVERLSDVISQLHLLFNKFGYSKVALSGRVALGCLHFSLPHAFDLKEETDQYGEFLDSLAQLILCENKGSMYGQQGTGRLGAPFLRMEWGDDAYDLMKEIRSLFDPNQVMNPGVIFNDIEHAYLTQLKVGSRVDDGVDACHECGLCESTCPSQSVGLTPRQRIAVLRAMAQPSERNDLSPIEWGRHFQERGVDTCVATGMCEEACPMGINTGTMMLKLRSRKNRKYEWIAAQMSRHFAATTSWFRGGLLVGSMLQNLFGRDSLEAGSIKLRRLTGHRTPVWLANTPGMGKPIYARNRRIDPKATDTIVYWPSCVTQSFGARAANEDQLIPTAIQNVLRKAQLKVVSPQPTRGLCCGLPFYMKGHTALADEMADELIDALWEVSSAGRYPVLNDSSACSFRLLKKAKERGLQLFDSNEFIDKFLMNRLIIEPVREWVAVHVTCSTLKQGTEKSFFRTMNQLAPNWIHPDDIACCGFGGDSGYLQPEVSQFALRSLSNQVKECSFGISTNRTCEIGLSQYSGLIYYSIFEILDKHSTVRTDLEL